ncbi:S-layer homology domain-containing protein [Microbacteriaceae bacterium VKM Ac-2854]|nr:S-layer homology domain-containing protein [Microbacteriaceae bacterium VKM Ac-2854]
MKPFRPDSPSPLRRMLGVLLAAVLVATIAPYAAATDAAPSDSQEARRATVSEVEPNGSTQTANQVALGNSVQGSTFASGGSDADYFAYDAPAAGRATIRLTFPAGLGADTAYEMRVYNQNGDALYDFTVGGADYTGDRIANRSTFVPAGRFYIRLLGYSSYLGWGQTYSLNTSLTPGAVETEFNNDTSTADVVALGSAIQGSTLASGGSDADYFAYDAPAAGRATIRLTFPAGLGADTAYEMRVYNQNGDALYDFTVGGADYTGDRIANRSTFVPAGRFYIRLLGYSSYLGWGQTYSLNTSLTPGAVETEFNNDTSTADVVALGSAIQGSTLASGGSDADYFAYDAPAAGNATLRFTFPAGLGSGTAYELRVYDENGDRLYDFTATGADSDGSRIAGQQIALASGRSYVRVLGYSSYLGWGKTYDLSVAFPLNAGTPTISGTPSIGSSLTANPGTWTPAPVSFGYQWNRDGAAISGATGSSYTVTIADVDRKLTVAVTGSKPGSAAQTRTSAAVTGRGSFTDVSSSNPFFADIEWMKAEGISTGTKQADGTFLYKPSDPVSRQAMASFLYRYSDETFTAPATPSFTDVPTSNPFYTAIEWMKAEGISTGYPQPDGTVLYKPVDAVSREAMAAFLYRFSDDTFTPPTTPSFTDVPTTSTFYTAIEWMKAERISTGYAQPDGTVTYRPSSPVTREAMAAFLHRYDGR